MKIFKLSLFFLLISEIKAFAYCNSSLEISLIRQKIRNTAKNYKTLTLVTDFAIYKNFSNNLIKSDSVLLKFLEVSIHKRFPLLAIGEFNENEFDFLHFTAAGSWHNMRNEIKIEIVSTIPSFNVDICFSEGVESKIMYYDFGTPICIKLFACELSNPGIYKRWIPSNKKIIYMMNIDMIKKNTASILYKNQHYEQKFLTFDEFDEQGLCICDYVDYYINDCKDIKGRKKESFGIYLYLILVGVIFTFLLICEIYSCMIRKP